MSPQVAQAADTGVVTARSSQADLDRQDHKDFEQFVGDALRSAEMKRVFADDSTGLEKLRSHLMTREAALTGAVSPDRKAWKEAVRRADHPRDAVQEDHADQQTMFYRFVFVPILVLFAVSGVSAVVCLFVGYLAATSRPSLASWRPAGLISAAVSVASFFLGIILAQRNITWTANRETGTYRNAANLARSEYADALKKRLLGEARTWINDHPDEVPAPNWDKQVPTPGLSEVYNRANQVLTEASGKLASLITQLSGGGTIGLAGPRGAGKTSLIREYIQDDQDKHADTMVLSLMVSAPVEYQPLDFAVHLLYMLCGAYLTFRGENEDERSDPVSRLAEFFTRRPGKPKQPGAGPSADGDHRQLIARAKLYRKQIDAQHSYTTTVGGSLSTPGNIASTSGQVAGTATDLPRSYPDLVGRLRSFLKDVAWELHGPEKAESSDGADEDQGGGGHVVIGIDELDKLSDAKQAQRLVNELKAILGVPYCYYLISISDDALAAYEMRGLPARDAFDSAFDEVIHVRYLDLAGSERLLDQRVIGMWEPFAWLCHCLSGGLPRDLIRAARHVVIAAVAAGTGGNRLGAVCQELVRQELHQKLDASWINRAGGGLSRADSELLHAIQRLLADEPSLGEPGAQGYLCSGLGRIVGGLAQAGPPPAGPRPGAGAPESAVPALASYLHYLLTLLEVFTPPPTDRHTIVDARGNPGSRGLLDQLCLARQTLGADPRWAWLTIETFRENWGLTPAYRYPGDADDAAGQPGG